MGWHVDGGPSLLHMNITLFGKRVLKCKVLGKEVSDGAYDVEVLQDHLCPGSVYLSSPACCLHSVHYDSQPKEAVNQPPNTLTIHLRSDLFRSRHGPSVFHKSNRLLAEVVAPIVARHLASEPFQLPSMQEIDRVIGMWAIKQSDVRI